MIARMLALADAVSIRTKIMGIVVGLILLLGLGATYQLRQYIAAVLSGEMDQRAVSIARDLAARSSDLILTNNSYALYELARDTMQNNQDVRYVLIVRPEGSPLIHTFGQRLPEGLIEANFAGPQDRYREETLETEEGLIRDVAVPIFEGRAGTARVGLSNRRLERELETATEQLLLMTGVVGVVGLAAAYLLTLILTQPISEMVRVVRAVERGDLGTRVRPRTRDEIGVLGQAFNSMAESLSRSQAKTEEFNQRLLRKQELQQRLLDSIIGTQEEERKRVARELHDETSQVLTSLVLGLEGLAAEPGLSESARDRTNHLRALSSGALEGVHDLALELRPSALDDAGLVHGIARYLREYERRHGLEVDFRTVGTDGLRLLPAAETAVFRIVQEALTNVARHARAQGVSVLLERRGANLVTVVEDDGCGFDPGAVAAAPIQERLGLAGMAERAALVGGRLALESQPQQGTTVFVTVPLADNLRGEVGDEQTESIAG